jgi:transcriptional regulator with XRE-family HTH domain
MTLQELEDRTGIGSGAISRLENDPASNPTILTLQRIASALGKQLTVQLTDAGRVAEPVQ